MRRSSSSACSACAAHAQGGSALRRSARQGGTSASGETRRSPAGASALPRSAATAAAASRAATCAPSGPRLACTSQVSGAATSARTRRSSRMRSARNTATRSSGSSTGSASYSTRRGAQPARARARRMRSLAVSPEVRSSAPSDARAPRPRIQPATAEGAAAGLCVSRGDAGMGRARPYHSAARWVRFAGLAETIIYTLAHLSDLHATPVEPRGLTPLLGKRVLGFLSWRLRRRHAHKPEVLAALIEDLHAQSPDHVAVTGDLTNISLPDEFPAARAWLERIGDPEWVSAVPGNHDAYVRIPRARSWDLWSEWLRPDHDWRAAAVPGTDYPSVRVRGPLALVGLCSAQPTLPFLAGGSLGRAQLQRLEAALVELRARSLVRIVLVHHAAVPGMVGARRALWDAPALAAVLARAGAE